MKRLFRNNGLSLTLGLLFLIFWACQAYCGWKVELDDARLHGRALEGFGSYLASGHFWQATGENWESEFLQMGAYVVLTSFLFQKGSAESKDPDHPDEGSLTPAQRPQYRWAYRYSLSLVLLGLFLASAAVHALGGLAEENQERAEHALPPESLASFVSGSEFWFQSFQNWQSEFLAVLAIVVLSIFLRQDGSPESKPVGSDNSKTGN